MKRFVRLLALLTVFVMTLMVLPLTASASKVKTTGWNVNKTKFLVDGKTVNGIVLIDNDEYIVTSKLQKNKIVTINKGKNAYVFYSGADGLNFFTKGKSLYKRIVYTDGNGKIRNDSFWGKKGNANYYFLNGVAIGNYIVDMDDGTYYFDKNCKRKTGWVTFKKNKAGVRTTLDIIKKARKTAPPYDFYSISAYQPLYDYVVGKMYFDKKTGNALTGWQKIGNKVYHFTDKGILMTSKDGKYQVNESTGIVYEVSSSGICKPVPSDSVQQHQGFDASIGVSTPTTNNAK